MIKIRKDTIEKLKTEKDFFVDFYKKSCENVLFRLAKLWPKLNRPSLIDAYWAWNEDLRRVQDFERLDHGLDHFKMSGHLAFWLRRMTPIVDVTAVETNYQDSQSDITPEEQEWRDFLFGYVNEFMAFNIGLAICEYYTGKKAIYKKDYIKMICHMMRYKNVSPHAIILIYKSIFDVTTRRLS